MGTRLGSSLIGLESPDGGKGGVVPLHLVDLYNQATEDRTEQEQEDIANLLAKYSQAFSKHESDLDVTGFACDNFILRILQ
jgi:hypothetical protein